MAHVDVGWIVRVPLGGRRVRGYVVERGSRDIGRLKPVAAVSGSAPVFDEPLLGSLRWAAERYVAPLGVLLERAAPPNVPPAPPPAEGPLAPLGRTDPGVFSDLAEAALAGRRRRPLAVVDSLLPAADLARLGAALTGGGGTLCLVAPTTQEAGAAAKAVGSELVVDAETEDSRATEVWAQVVHHGGVVVGTPRIALWNLRRPAVVAILEDGRRAHKERQTPTLHVRDVVRARSRREGMWMMSLGPTPSLELFAGGAEIRRPSGKRRAWPLVEVVDRRLDPPGSGLLAETSRRAVHAVVAAGGRVFLFAHRRGYAAASRCVACRELRRCPGCGSRPDPGPLCTRCGTSLGPCPACGGARFEPLGSGAGRLLEEAGRSFGREAVAPHPGPAPVTVGTEADLTEVGETDLVVLVDTDGLVHGTNYRAAEEGLRIGARLAGKVSASRNGRLIVQTSDPAHPVVAALRKGDPEPFLRGELGAREELGYPPAAELLLVEVRGEVDEAGADGDLRSLPGPVSVLGPAPVREGRRWLVQAPSLDGFRRALRPLVQRWRDGGATVRVDADPIDL